MKSFISDCQALELYRYYDTINFDSSFVLLYSNKYGV